jgi:hypothetical protein
MIPGHPRRLTAHTLNDTHLLCWELRRLELLESIPYGHLWIWTMREDVGVRGNPRLERRRQRRRWQRNPLTESSGLNISGFPYGHLWIWTMREDVGVRGNPRLERRRQRRRWQRNPLTESSGLNITGH